jgi:hypothetical protein
MTLRAVVLAHAGGGALDRFFEAGAVAAVFTLMSAFLLAATVKANRQLRDREYDADYERDPTR